MAHGGGAVAPARTSRPSPPRAGPRRGVAGGAADRRRPSRPVILAGGGARRAERPLRALAETARRAGGADHQCARPAACAIRLPCRQAPACKAVRALIAEADLVIAVGTEFGPTDYDMYADGGFVAPKALVRIDIDAEQLDRQPATVRIEADSAAALRRAAAADLGSAAWPARRTARRAPHGCRDAALRRDRPPACATQLAAVEAIRDALPGAIIVGDSTQPVYAANLYYDHDRPGGWFNAATGFGALGYGPPAAIGAAIAAARRAGRLPDRRWRLPVHAARDRRGLDAARP